MKFTKYIELYACSIQEEVDNAYAAIKKAKELQKPAETHRGRYYAIIRVLVTKNSE